MDSLHEVEVSAKSTAPNCLFNRQCPLATSCIAENPVKRFYGCATFRSGGCGFFRWHDGEVYNRGKEVILWLKRENNLLTTENGRLRSKLTELHREIQNFRTSEIESLLLRFIVIGVIVVFLFWLNVVWITLNYEFF